MPDKEKDVAAERRQAYVRALEVEREGYVRRGLPDRVKQVDAAIAAAKGEVSGRKSSR